LILEATAGRGQDSFSRELIIILFLLLHLGILGFFAERKLEELDSVERERLKMLVSNLLFTVASGMTVVSARAVERSGCE
jgi:hypothetical protein